MSDESRLDSVTKNIGRGNHKSARDRPEALKDQALDDVTRGFALPLPAKVAPLIPGAEVAPMGLAAQNTISEAGEIMPKDRLTLTTNPSRSAPHGPSTTECAWRTTSQWCSAMPSGE